MIAFPFLREKSSVVIKKIAFPVDYFSGRKIIVPVRAHSLYEVRYHDEQSMLKKHRFSLKEFLTIALRITNSLAQVHAANIIHKDRNPSHLALNPTNGQLKLIDIGIGRAVIARTSGYQASEVLGGTLAYPSKSWVFLRKAAMDSRLRRNDRGTLNFEICQ